MVDEERLSGSRDRGVRRTCDASFASVSDRTSDRLRQSVIAGDWRVVLQDVNDQPIIDRKMNDATPEREGTLFGVALLRIAVVCDCVVNVLNRQVVP